MAARQRLTPERVVAAAVALADDEGLDALTMRALGERLGVQAMSLYNHVDNKDALVDAMVDHVYGRVDLPRGDGWREAVTRRAVSLRVVLVRHPWAIGLLDTRTSPGPNNLAHHDAMLGVLLGAGVSLRQATFAYGIMDAFVYGFALQESALPFASAEELADVSDQVMARVDAEAYPHLARSARELPGTGYSFTDQFDDGLAIVLDGIERRWAGARGGD